MEIPEFVLLNRGRSWLWINSKLTGDPIVNLIANPDRLFSEKGCVLVKDQRKIKVARIPLEISGKICGVYVKRYNAFSMYSWLVSLFVPSGAVRSLRGSAILKTAGIATAKSVAAVEFRRWGMVEASFYLAEEIVEGNTADAYWRDELAAVPGKEGRRRRQRFIEKLAFTFQALHRSGVYHNDLKDANIIVVAKEDTDLLYLLDLEGVRRCSELRSRRRIKNIVQLNRTLGRFLRRTEKLHFLNVYLGSIYKNKFYRRHWLNQVLSQTRRTDRNNRRHCGPAELGKSVDGQ